MVLLDATKTITVDGITVMPDHADPNAFWYLPGPVSLARRADGLAIFTFIKYKPAAVSSGVKGGGFAIFNTALTVSPATEKRIISQLSALTKGQPTLNVVPFDSGTVKCVALNLQGAAGTIATPAPAGAFNAVEQILGSNTPSLAGDEQAMFSVTLSQEGAIILEQAYRQGAAPIGVVYDLKYTGIRPSLNVKITADYSRMYRSFSASLSGQYYFFKLGIDVAFEKLVQNGAIKVEIQNFTTSQNQKDQEKWALALFKDNLMTEWFTPTLAVGAPKVTPVTTSLPDKSDDAKAKSPADGANGDKNKTADPADTDKKAADTPADTDKKAADTPADTDKKAADAPADTDKKAADAPADTDKKATDAPADTDKKAAAGAEADKDKAAGANGDAPPPAASDGSQTPMRASVLAGPTGFAMSAAAAATAPAVAHAPAALTIVSRDPDPLPSGYTVSHAPATAGIQETITVSGGDTAPTVKVDDVVKTLDASRQFTIDVEPGASHDISIEYAATERASETFNLNFQYDEPKAAHFSDNPPSPSYTAYLKNKPSPADAPFSRSQATGSTSANHGADALHEWINTKLAAPKEVQLDAHSSFEGHTDSAHVRYNFDLSGRRLKVAMGIIGKLAKITSFKASGDDAARTANPPRLSTPNGTEDNPDRVVHIKGFTGPATPASTIRAQIVRAADPAPTPDPPPKPDPAPKPAPDPKPDPKPDPAPKPNPAPTPDPSPKPADNPKADDKPKTLSTPTLPKPEIAGSPAIAFKLKFLQQEELKTLTLVYNRMDAEQRTYSPPGPFSLLLSDLADSDKHFVEVDLDDPFFREFAVTVQAPIDFARIGLQSAHASLDYGSPGDEVNHKHDDVIFDPSRPKEHKFSVFMNAARDTTYRYATEYHFDPESGWDGRTFSYQLPFKVTEDRNLFLNPFDQIGFVEVQLIPHSIDKGVMDSIDVNLSHADPDGSVIRRTLNVTPGSAPQFWRFRSDDPKARDYTYQFTHHLKNGTTRQSTPVQSNLSALTVNDPFEDAIEVDFVPLLNPAITRSVFVDIEYNDEKNSYRREERFTVEANAKDPVHFRMALFNSKLRAYRYRFTFIGVNNQMNQRAFQETAETLIAISDSV